MGFGGGTGDMGSYSKGGFGQPMAQPNVGMWGRNINTMGASYAQPAQAASAPAAQTGPSLFLNSEGNADPAPAASGIPVATPAAAAQQDQFQRMMMSFMPQRGGVRYNQSGYGSGVAALPQAMAQQLPATGIQSAAPISWNPASTPAYQPTQLAPITAQQAYVPPAQDVASAYQQPAAASSGSWNIGQSVRGTPSNEGVIQANQGRGHIIRVGGGYESTRGRR